jgi:hypothetical protein
MTFVPNKNDIRCFIPCETEKIKSGLCSCNSPSIRENFPTYIFSGMHNCEKFEIPIKAINRESAIGYFEVTFRDYKWYMTEEIN